MNFILYLDESGDFITNDSNKRKNPSLVGGFVVNCAYFSEQAIEKILQCESVHATELTENNALVALGIINRAKKSQTLKFVVFENTERICIIDSDTTYLNICAEGILKLISTMNAEYGKQFRLHIVLGYRRITSNSELSEKTYISEKEYTTRLTEKLILASAKYAFPQIEKSISKIEFMHDKNRDNKALMISDIICNTWLTRTSSKFNDVQRMTIENIYTLDYMFSIYENSRDFYIKRLLSEANFDDAFLKICEQSPIDGNDLRTALKAVERLDDKYLAIYVNLFVTKAGRLIKTTNYELSEKILKNSLVFIDKLSSMRNNRIFFHKEKLDVYLYLSTIYNRLGLTELTEKMLTECELLKNNMMLTLENINYYFIIKNRLATHKIDLYNYLGGLEIVNEALNVLDDFMELMPAISVVPEDGGFASEQRAKLLGTKLQILTYLSKFDKKYFHEACEVSNDALHLFENHFDVKRQCQYRCKLEYENDRLDEALYWYCRSREMKKTDDVEAMVKDLENRFEPFALLHMLNIFKVAAKSDKIMNVQIAKRIGRIKKLAERLPDKIYPYELIWLKMALLLFELPQSTDWEKILIKTSNFCLSQKENTCRYIIGLACAASLIGFYSIDVTSNRKKIEKKLQFFKEKYLSFLELDIVEDAKEFLMRWCEVVTEMDYYNSYSCMSVLKDFIASATP